MKPFDDTELKQLLHEWEAPQAPAGLRDRVMVRRPQSWWRWLFTGTLRVPVPIAAAALILAAVWAYGNLAGRFVPPPLEPVVSLADFQPVTRIEPVLVGEQK
jgi:hypothetical protein